MLKIIFHRGRQFIKTQPDTFNYGMDGLLTVGALSIAANNNNLFAQRLGATDFQLTLLQFFPHLLAILILIPAGIFVGSLQNKRKVISLMLLLTGIFFVVISVSAFVPTGVAVFFFLIFFAMASVSINGMYNITWQAFFPEVVPEEKRNNVLTFRTRMNMIVSLIVPLAVGGILTSIPSMEGKIAAHQIFYASAALFLFANAYHFRKIKTKTPADPKRISFTELKTALIRLKSNKAFIIFTSVVLFFHMTWHIDWTLFFIAQANYLLMNELSLALVPVSGMIAQLLTLKFWSKNNIKQGIDLPIVYSIAGLVFLPFALILALNLPSPFGVISLVVLHFFSQLTFANLSLNLFQCLLKVVDEEYRSLSISVYVCIITLSNAIMPMVGVLIYTALGGTALALQITFVGIALLRIVAAGLWMLRLRSHTHGFATSS